MSQIVYCEKCGAYLGDRVNGVLYRFGKVVIESHHCQEGEIRLTRDDLDEIDRLAHYEKQRSEAER